MKKKRDNILLLIFGIILLCGSVVFTIIEMKDIDIIGGAGIHTFLFVFRYGNSGVYSALGLLGVGVIITAVVMEKIRRKKQ